MRLAELGAHEIVHPVLAQQVRMLLVVVALAAQATSHGATFVDDSGRTLELRAPPRRLVTLAPSLTEIVFTVGGGPLVIATGEGSDHPPEALRLPRVADHRRIDIERLVTLQPDLVLAWGSGNTMPELAQLEGAGVPLFRIEPRRLDDVPRALERVGALVGREEAGRAAARALSEDLDALRARYAHASPVRVFYQVWARPLLTLNDEHLVSDVIRLCGGRNVFGTLWPLVPSVSTESVVAADPEAIVTARDEGGSRAERAPEAHAFGAWKSLRSMAAVRRGWMFTVHGDLVARAGPRIAEGAREMCGLLDEVRRERGR
jgi:iron complex transport system substrate-binding protein